MLGLLSKLYSQIVSYRNKRYLNGKANVHECLTPVISIGNISLGGTGKTPFTIYLANELKKLNISSAIVGRGYKRESKEMVVVSNGSSDYSDLRSSGDEMLLISEQTSSPVVVSKRKYEAALFAQENFKIDCIIVDDGFQHRQLKRVLDIVFINNETFEKSDLIPKGRLREPLKSLNRADMICFDQDFKYKNQLSDLLVNEIPCYEYSLRVNLPYYAFSSMNPPQESLHKLSEGVIAVSGIANPERFEKTLFDNGFNVVWHEIFKDHHNFSKADIASIIKTCKKFDVGSIIITEKDLMKLRQFGSVFDSSKIMCYVLPIKMDFGEISELLIKKVKRNLD